MAHTDAFRNLVVARAGGACESCRLLQSACGVTFHIEHAVPRSRGDLTVMSNLALSCPGCNLSKAERVTGEDRHGQIQFIFNPRDFEPWLLGWHLHFVLDHESGYILPRTPKGEATVGCLKMNESLRIFARRIQIQAGLIA